MASCPMPIRTMRGDSRKEFTDRLCGLRRRAATGGHMSDRPCTEPGIGQRLTPPIPPRTGRTGRFDRRIAEVPQGCHVRSGGDPGMAPHRHVRPPLQSAPGGRVPLHAMKGCHKPRLRLFRGRPQVLTGCDTAQARDSRVRDAVPHGNDAPVGAELGQVSPRREDAFKGPVRVREVMRKRRKGGAPHPRDTPRSQMRVTCRQASAIISRAAALRARMPIMMA